MLGGRLDESLSAVRAVFSNPALRRVELAFAGSAVGLYAASIAVAVYVFHHGGTTAVGVFLFVRLTLASAFAPVAASLADRYRRERVMLASDLGRILTVSGTAAAAVAGVPAAVYVLATLTSILGSAFKPAESALLPSLARSPEELTAANVCSSTFDSVGSFAGPALGALLLAFGGPATVFGLVAVTFAWSASFIVRVRSPDRQAPPADEPASDGGERFGGLAGGVRALRQEPRLQLLFAFYGAQALVAGAWGVLVIVIAIQLAGLGNSGVGILESASGIGSVVGAGLVLLLVARRRLASDLRLGVFLWGAPLVLVGLYPHAWLAIAAVGVVGLGNTIVDVAAVTLIQRTAPEEVAGRVFGVLESALIGALALGALLAPLLVRVAGERGSVIAAGALLPVVALLASRPLAAIDRGARVPAEQLEALRSVSFLAPLPLREQEALAAAMTPLELPAGATLFERGDHGDRFYVLAAGSLSIELPVGTKVEDAPGYVGEIALLRDVPRTATVRARTDATLWALERDDFLGAVTGHARSSNAAESVVASRAVVSTA
ncbi:MAG TPA: MFS transporter [Gaiellaceae bacterium]|nr:MFS transporter [Gaiellaceae bacterium]